MKNTIGQIRKLTALCLVIPILLSLWTGVIANAASAPVFEYLTCPQEAISP